MAMGNRTLDRIKGIEEKAALIVKQARDASYLELKKTHQRHMQELQTLEAEIKKDKEGIILSAEKKAQEEANRIEAQSQKEISELKKKTQPRIEAAKKEILRCLS
jgi:vacuolar-type H+-ATPase subunit H